jgi:TolB-like protein/class 3 adenylate cyclase/Flp pilus assembly protein TadD
MSQTRRLAAILAADVAGYSRLMGADEEGTLERLKALRRDLVDPKIAEHRGRIVKTTGDGMLVEFASVVDAVRCAVEVQQAMPERNIDFGADTRIELRIGVNLGDVIVDEDDIYGDGVNIAARLEALAEPGGVCISRVVREQIRDKLPYPFEDTGQQSVKNIARPVRAYVMGRGALASLPAVAAPVRPVNSKREVGEPITGATPRLSIVVLPFANLSSDPEQEYFADGITDDLTTDLSRIPDALVIARNTAFTYKGKSVDAKQIGRELGVRYLLDGSVRRTADQVRVNVQLIDAENGVQLWADRFDTDRANLAAAQDEITGRLARTFNLELVKDMGRRIEQEGAVDPDARDLVMRGWSWYHRPRSTTTLGEAQRAFERALEIEPGSVDARIGVASVLAVTLANGWNHSVQQDQERAELLLLEALERDPKRSMAHFSLGILRRFQNRLSEARIEHETAIALDQNNSRAFHQLGLTLMFLGQPDAAISHFEKAIRLNPHDANIADPYGGLGTCYLLLGQVDQAIDLLRKARAANPRLWYIHLNLAGGFGLRGDLDEARASLAKAIELKPEMNSLAWLRAYPGAADRQHRALFEQTVAVGLRRAGLPDE